MLGLRRAQALEIKKTELHQSDEARTTAISNEANRQAHLRQLRPRRFFTAAFLGVRLLDGGPRVVATTQSKAMKVAEGCGPFIQVVKDDLEASNFVMAQLECARKRRAAKVLTEAESSSDPTMRISATEARLASEHQSCYSRATDLYGGRGSVAKTEVLNARQAGLDVWYELKAAFPAGWFISFEGVCMAAIIMRQFMTDFEEWFQLEPSFHALYLFASTNTPIKLRVTANTFKCFQEEVYDRNGPLTQRDVLYHPGSFADIRNAPVQMDEGVFRHIQLLANTTLTKFRLTAEHINSLARMSPIAAALLEASREDSMYYAPNLQYRFPAEISKPYSDDADISRLVTVYPDFDSAKNALSGTPHREAFIETQTYTGDSWEVTNALQVAAKRLRVADHWNAVRTTWDGLIMPAAYRGDAEEIGDYVSALEKMIPGRKPYLAEEDEGNEEDLDQATAPDCEVRYPFDNTIDDPEIELEGAEKFVKDVDEVDPDWMTAYINSTDSPSVPGLSYEAFKGQIVAAANNVKPETRVQSPGTTAAATRAEELSTSKTKGKGKMPIRPIQQPATANSFVTPATLNLPIVGSASRGVARASAQADVVDSSVRDNATSDRQLGDKPILVDQALSEPTHQPVYAAKALDASSGVDMPKTSLATGEANSQSAQATLAAAQATAISGDATTESANSTSNATSATETSGQEPKNLIVSRPPALPIDKPVGSVKDHSTKNSDQDADSELSDVPEDISGWALPDFDALVRPKSADDPPSANQTLRPAESADGINPGDATTDANVSAADAAADSDALPSHSAEDIPPPAKRAKKNGGKDLAAEPTERRRSGRATKPTAMFGFEDRKIGK